MATTNGYTKVLVGFERVSPKPLEAKTLFRNYSQALDYAQNDPTAYVGQVISTSDEGKVYVVKQDGLTKLLDRIETDDGSRDQRGVEYTYSNVSSIELTHGLGYKPELIFLDENGVRMYPLVEYPGDNTIKISWNGIRSGKFYLI